jgi:DNA repair exonuclease SbcCD ATPase subunit|tara:strand:+ start:2574 stop:4922 length:2349 start_codon:yes stop_codon:yes gene_type:complete
MNNTINIPEYAKVKVYWDDKPENYSRQAKLKVRDYFHKKYGISKTNIDVVYRPVKIGKNGEVIEISGAGVDNILDPNYQVELMKEWFKRNGKTVDFPRLLDLDRKVNGSLEEQGEIKSHRSWSLKWLYLDNFLSFGDKNFVSFGKLNGLNVVNSEPPNQGGKTNFTVDAIKFLLFGKTTKTDKNEQVFNTFTDKDDLSVRGMIEVEGQEMIIERLLSRRAKRTGGWNITNKVNYYKILPDGEEELMNEEDSKKTGEIITNNVGTESDFDITILATARNLEDLIDAKPTESGRLLTKFIGLEIVEAKEVIAKKMYSDFNKNKKGNHYDITTLLNDNTTLEENLTSNGENLKLQKENLQQSEDSIARLNGEKERLLSGKLNIDVEIAELNPEVLEQEIIKVTEKGVTYKEKINNFQIEIDKIKDIQYDEYKYNELEKEDRTLTIGVGTLNSDIKQFGKVIDNLKDSEICQTCNRPLDDIDNTQKIKEYEDKIQETEKLIKSKNLKLTKIKDSMSKIKENKETVDRRDRLELERDKTEVEIGSLRNKLIAKKADLKKYKANKDAINTNILIDADISSVKTSIIAENNTKSIITQKIFTTEQAIKTDEAQIDTNTKMIKALKKEEEVEKIFKVYLEMIGKKGISKLVLRSVLPIINSELQRLLDDICDFEIELIITNKNEVEYHIIKNDVSKLLKSGSGLERTISSLALRCVLGKISHLPKPNFITFDEVLGKVAAENVEKLQIMFGKIKDMFDIVFFISHNDLVKDWGDKVITIKKVNNVSSIKV